MHILSDECAFMRAAGVTVPEQYGGLDLGYLHHCIAMEVKQ